MTAKRKAVAAALAVFLATSCAQSAVLAGTALHAARAPGSGGDLAVEDLCQDRRRSGGEMTHRPLSSGTFQ